MAMMKWLLVLLGFSVVLPGAALAQACPPEGKRVPEKKLYLSVNSVDTIYSSELDRAGLSRLAGGPPIYGMFYTGLTRWREEAAVISNMWMVDLGEGRRCVGLGRVDAAWRLPEMLVNIASEYPPGGCNYRVVRDHEDQHVAFARQFHREWAPRIEQVLKAEMDRLQPEVTTDDLNTAIRKVNARLAAAMAPTIHAFKTEARAKNSTIDTRANYALVNSRCPSW
jgi:hypothetical protein